MNPAPPVTMIMAAGYRSQPGQRQNRDERDRPMVDRPRFFDDLAGVAGGALSALAGVREELDAMVRATIEEAVRRLDLVRREEFDAAIELAANARAWQEAAEERVATLEARVAVLETRLATGSSQGERPTES
jgi:BMFP domain-containing protein YqiC